MKNYTINKQNGDFSCDSCPLNLIYAKVEDNTNIDCIDCCNCTGLLNCKNCCTCVSCINCINCQRCEDCYNCNGLLEEQFCIENVRYTKEAYFILLKDLGVNYNKLNEISLLAEQKTRKFNTKLESNDNN